MTETNNFQNATTSENDHNLTHNAQDRWDQLRPPTQISTDLPTNTISNQSTKPKKKKCRGNRKEQRRRKQIRKQEIKLHKNDGHLPNRVNENIPLKEHQVSNVHDLIDEQQELDEERDISNVSSSLYKNSKCFYILLRIV